MTKKVVNFILGTGLIMLSACGPSQQITGTWVNQEQKVEPYGEVFVYAITARLDTKLKTEQAFTSSLAKYGVTAMESNKSLPPSMPKGEEAIQIIVAKAKSAGATAILTATMIDAQSETRYVQGTTSYNPMPYYGGYYGSFGGYYGYASPYAYDPGYYTTDKTYFLEANLYDIETQTLITSIQSEAYNPGGLDKSVQTYANIISAQLNKEGLLAKSND